MRGKETGQYFTTKLNLCWKNVCHCLWQKCQWQRKMIVTQIFFKNEQHMRCKDMSQYFTDKAKNA
jgi:hypothetical protein